MKNLLCAVAMAASSICHASQMGASTAPFVVDVSGALSISSVVGFGFNEVRTYNIGAGAHITGVTYDVTITAFDPSKLSEAMLEIAGTDPELGGTVIIAGRGVEESGTRRFQGSVDFVDRGFDFWIGDDGLLRLEFFEGYEDVINGVSGAPNAVWASGVLSFQYTPATVVPEPATWLMMGLGFAGIGAALRSRRR